MLTFVCNAVYLGGGVRYFMFDTYVCYTLTCASLKWRRSLELLLGALAGNRTSSIWTADCQRTRVVLVSLLQHTMRLLDLLTTVSANVTRHTRFTLEVLPKAPCVITKGEVMGILLMPCEEYLSLLNECREGQRSASRFLPPLPWLLRRRCRSDIINRCKRSLKLMTWKIINITFWCILCLFSLENRF